MIIRSRLSAFAAAAVLSCIAPGAVAFADPPATDAPAAAAPATTDAAGPGQLPPPTAGKGQVVFYRKPLFSLVPFNWYVREGKTKICEMVAGTYCVAMVDPGTHTYEVHSEVKNDLTLEIDAGETYYVIGGISMGLVVNHPTISPAQKAQFDAISAKLKVKAPPEAEETPAASPTT